MQDTVPVDDPQPLQAFLEDLDEQDVEIQSGGNPEIDLADGPQLFSLLASRRACRLDRDRGVEAETSINRRSLSVKSRRER